MTDTPLNYRQPFELLPNRVWRTWRGGKLLDELQHNPEPADGPFPEDWVGSATRAANVGREEFPDEGVADAHAVNGRVIPMTELIAQAPAEALGADHVAAFGAQPQLLVKLLDSGMRLHIQAHPSVAWAKEHLGSPNGKTEAWWVLATRQDDAWVYMGFQRPPSPAEWLRIVDEQDIDAMLACFDRVPVKPGDVLLIEGGVPHAIGPGLLLVEIQEPTDYVVRCEYAHGGVALPEEARTMGLGLDAVLDMFDYTPRPLETVAEAFGPRRRTIVDNDAGRETMLLGAGQTDRLEAREVVTTGQGPFALADDGRFSILIVLAGEGRIAAGGASMELKPFSRVFLPAAAGSATLNGELRIARCLPPRPAL